MMYEPRTAQYVSATRAYAYTTRTTGRISPIPLLGRAAAMAAMLVAVLCMVATLAAAPAHAQEGTGNTNTIETYNNDKLVTTSHSSHVVQGLNGHTFAAASPISTIYIDPSINSTAARNAATFTRITTEPAFVVRTKGSDTNLVAYDPSQSGAKQLQAGQVTQFSGDLFSFTFKDMAVLQDNSRADVVITYSNANIALSSDASPTGGIRYLASGNMVYAAIDGFDSYSTASYARLKASMYGLKMDINVKVVKDGQTVNGTFFYPMTDVDIVRGDTWFFSKIADAGTNMNYSEQILVKGARIRDANGNSIYVPDDLEVIELN